MRSLLGVFLKLHMNVQQGKNTLDSVVIRVYIYDISIQVICKLCAQYPSRLSASCVHISALRHALVALTPNVDVCEDSDDEHTPITSLPCQWKSPRKRKYNAKQVSRAHFDKLEYGKAKKYSMQCLEEYDPVKHCLNVVVIQIVYTLLNVILFVR